MRFACRLMIPFLLASVVACGPGSFREAEFEKTLAVTNDRVNLSVETAAGGITVRSGSDSSVHIRARIRARESFLGGGSADEKVRKIKENPPIQQQGNTIRITRPTDTDLRENVSIQYDITVPAQTQLTATSGAGNANISGLALPVEATTGAGAITAEDLAGDVRLHTGAGAVNAKSIGGALEIESGAGSIRAQGVPKHDWRIKAGAGSIRLEIPADASFDLDAQSGFGRVSVSDSLGLKDGSVSNSRVRGKVGNGGPMVEISNGAGSIDVSRGAGPS